jgi:hypothetical protein
LAISLVGKVICDNPIHVKKIAEAVKLSGEVPDKKLPDVITITSKIMQRDSRPHPIFIEF